MSKDFNRLNKAEERKFCRPIFQLLLHKASSQNIHLQNFLPSYSEIYPGVFAVIDRDFKRPTLSHSLKGKEWELQTIYNPHHGHLYPVSLQVFFILFDCSSLSSIFQEPATFAGEFPLFCSLWRYRCQWQHCYSHRLWIVSVHCFNPGIIIEGYLS